MSKLTGKQQNIFKVTRALNEHYGTDLVSWIKDSIDFSGLKLPSISWQQEEIVKTIYKEGRVAVSAGGGIGKSAIAAMLTIGHLCTQFYAKIPTTAPSSKLLDDILWSEINFWLKRCKYRDIFVSTRTKLSIKEFPEWYAVARTVPRDGKNISDTLAGFHSPNLLVIVDEASGVPNPVFTALDGAQTDKNARALLISNPVSTGGYYYDTISDPEGKGKDYKVLTYDSRDSPLVSKEYEQYIITRYGLNSPMYKAKVLGLPISELDTVLVTPEDFDRIVKNNRDYMAGRIILSADIARKGTDNTVFCIRSGDSIIEWKEFARNDTTYVVDQIIDIYRTRYSKYRFACVIDAVGVGAGVYDMLARLNYFPVVEFVGPESAQNSNMYINRRAEGYDNLRQIFPNLHFPVDPPERLKKELVNIRFDYTKGPIAIEDKRVMVSRLGFSPDYADALMMTTAVESHNLGKHAIYVPNDYNSVFKRLQGTRRDFLNNNKYSKFIT